MAAAKELDIFKFCAHGEIRSANREFVHNTVSAHFTEDHTY